MVIAAGICFFAAECLGISQGEALFVSRLLTDGRQYRHNLNTLLCETAEIRGVLLESQRVKGLGLQSMAQQTFQIEIDDQLVSVRLNASDSSPHGRIYACIFFIAILIFVLCAVLFLPGKHGSASMWHNLSSNPVDSQDFIVQFVLLLSCPVLMVLLLWRYTMFAWPSDETFNCDRSTVSLSKVPWLDFGNKDWETRFYPLAEIEDIRYQAIASVRGASIYCLRFKTGDKTQRVLPGLKPHEADRVLKALKAFGADVPDDPRLTKKLAEEDADNHWSRWPTK